MTIRVILDVLGLGDAQGSALRELALYYGCDDFDLSPITDEMAMEWMEAKKND